MAKSSIGFIGGGLGQVRLTLELTPQPSLTGGDILAVAILTSERRDVPISGQAVTFYLGPDEIVTPNTEDDGRAAYTFTGLGFGTHAVSIQVAGVHVTDRHTFSASAERVKRIAPPLVRAEGDEGKYVISVAVMLAEGGPGRDIPVRLIISPLGAAPRIVDKVTDANGFLREDLVFDEDECDVTIQILGHEVRIENLYGKSHLPKPRRYQRPDDAELGSGSLWGVIGRAWRRGREDTKGV